MPSTHPHSLVRRVQAALLTTGGVFAALCATASAGRAVITYGAEDRILTPPPASLLSAGWEYRAIRATDNKAMYWPITSEFVLGAKHIATSLKDAQGNPKTVPITYQGQTYNLVERFDDPRSDLTLYRLDRAIEGSVAPVFTGATGSELGRELFTIGQGFLEKKSAVSSTLPDGSTIANGWDVVNVVDGQGISWGQNRVADFVGIAANGQVQLDGSGYMYVSFDQPGTGDNIFGDAAQQNNEAMATAGDSGGAVFVREQGVWKLAGITYAMDAGLYYDAEGKHPLSPGELGNQGVGAIYDARGLYADLDGDGDRELINDSQPVATGWYATQLTHNRAWLESVTGANFGPVAVPEPGTLALLALPIGAMAVGRLRRHRRQ